jgi:transglutaminase-like putative cysteine protease
MKALNLDHSFTPVSLSKMITRRIPVLILLLIIITIVAAGVSGVLIHNPGSTFWQCIFAGMLLGWIIGSVKRSSWYAGFLIVFLGIIFILFFTSGIEKLFWSVFIGLSRVSGHIASLATVESREVFTLFKQEYQLARAISVVLERSSSWLLDFGARQPGFDPVATGLIWNLVIWIVAAWAGWMGAAEKKALVAVLPAMFLYLATHSYAHAFSPAIFWLLLAVLILIALDHSGQRENQWNFSRIAYPRSKRRQLIIAAIPATLITVAIATMVSSVSYDRFQHWINDNRSTSPRSASVLAQSLGIQSKITATPDTFDTVRNPGLPRALLIGSGPELSREIVMSVQLTAPSEITQTGFPTYLYWRSFTYDVYTGYGWKTSQSESKSYPADQEIQAFGDDKYFRLHQVIRLQPGASVNVYAAGEPSTMNIPVVAAWRSSKDLFGLISEGHSSYTINSLIPAVPEEALQASTTEYPDWISQRYLDLPPGIPSRVVDLATQLTATEPTPYERARAIEQYLRKYPYSLDVPRPPSNHDFVDFFLFDLRKGYCDYFSSAMVVLARLSGIPARLAVGYTSGTYNLNSRLYQVSQADAHSWVEVYFTSVGWVPFEPTPSQQLLDRSGDIVRNEPPASISHVDKTIEKKSITPGYWVAASIFLLSLTVIILILVDEFRLRRLLPVAKATEVYRRVRQIGLRFKVHLDPGVTPFEFSTHFRQRVQSIPVPRIADKIMKELPEKLDILFGLIVSSCYSSQVEEGKSERQVIDQWKSIRWFLRLLWIFQFGSEMIQHSGGFRDETG